MAVKYSSKPNKTKKDCVFCNGNNFEKISDKVRDSLDYKVLKCKNCGLTQLSPMPTAKEDEKFYNQNRQAKNIKLPTDLKIIERNSFADTKRRVDMVSDYLRKKQSLLDIASGYGLFLKEMEKLGYKVTGIEVSEERRKDSSKVTKAKILNINLLNDDSALGNFDVITMFHVLEHIKDPVLFLKTAKKHLNKNGKLIIEVPNSDDLLLRVSEGYRDFYWQRAHLLYLNRNSLKKIVKKVGLSVVDIFYVQRYSLENFMNWFILGKPQISKPVFKTNSPYSWLEDYYKNYLCKEGETDTLVLIAK